jgi:DNA-binding LacI/PurR family transcriptional regulator
MEEKMPTTIKDVAKFAGVSISTVSLVINDNPAVKLATRKKVQEVIEKYNFKPNQNARSLVTKSKKIIGVIRMTDESVPAPRLFNSTVDTYMSEMLWDIESGIYVHGYSLLLDWYNVREPAKLPILMDENKVDGIISVGGIITDDFIEALSKSEIPAVLVGARASTVDYVDVDAEKSMFLAVNYMIQQGNHRIAFINNTDLSQSSGRKLAGFEKAVKNRPVKTWVSFCPFSGQAAYDAFGKIWEESAEKPTAVVCASDCMAVGVIRYMNDHGLKCPDDISVTGFEDGILAEYCIPALSTIRIHKDRLGAEACEVLFNRMRNPRAHRVSRIIEPELIIRNSVKGLNLS